MKQTESPLPDWFSPLPCRAGYIWKSIKHNLTNISDTSLLVLHEDQLVYERYFHGRTKDIPQAMFSVTKSIVSALVGIAIQDGLIRDVQQKAADFFPEAKTDDERKRAITVEHLLTMRSGLPGDGDRQESPWWRAADSGLAAFEMPLVAAPGGHFSYSSGPGMQALACLLSRAAGRNLFEYAREKLFAPLGMASVRWDAAADGASFGGFGISMAARDMLRFGQLYLNGGRWNGEQILPEGWVQSSIPRGLKDHRGYGYGYLFRQIEKKYPDTYQAQGQFGQFIDISPARNAVIVRTGCPGPVVTACIKTLRFLEKKHLKLQTLKTLFEMQGVPLDYLAHLK